MTRHTDALYDEVEQVGIEDVYDDEAGVDELVEGRDKAVEMSVLCHLTQHGAEARRKAHAVLRNDGTEKAWTPCSCYSARPGATGITAWRALLI